MTASTGDRCSNCLQPLGAPRPRYCPHCGQETHLRPPSLLEFAQQFGGAVLSTEGSLWRTLKLLVLRPGELTRQYFAGRRRHYVLPVRLYLTTSVVALFLLRVATPWSPDLQVHFDDDLTPAAVTKIEEAVRRAEEAAGASPEQVNAKVAEAVRKARAAVRADNKARRDDTATRDDTAKRDDTTTRDNTAKRDDAANRDNTTRRDDTATGDDKNAGSAPADEDSVTAGGDTFECEGLPTWICDRLKRRHTNDPAEMRRLAKEINERLIANVGAMMFLLLPSFALLTKIAWFNRRLRYTEHLVFALHLHAFWFLLLPLTLFQLGSLSAVAGLWSVVYALAALRRVFGGRLLPLVMRAAAVAVAYLTTMGMALAATAFFVLLT